MCAIALMELNMYKNYPLLPVVNLHKGKYLSIQLLLSAIFSVIYALTMVVTFIFLVKEAVESGYCSTTVIFFAFVAGVFVIAAIIHPQVKQKSNWKLTVAFSRS